MAKKENQPNINEDYEMNINSDAEIPGSTHLSNPLEQEDESEVEKLVAELSEQKDKFLRQAAEFDNFRKRTAKERVEYMQTAGRDVISSLLEVLDDMDRAEAGGNVTEGVGLIFNKLRNILQSKGLKAVDAKGQDFDVEQHEAITQLDAGDKMTGKVVDELEKGYSLNDKIIRFAKVVVGK